MIHLGSAATPHAARRIVNAPAVWAGKLTRTSLRLMRRRGNTLPGLVVEKLFPRFLPRALERLPLGVVVITGTNGKTTTTKMVSTILAQRYRVLTNDTGSNFVRGAIAATVEHATWTGRLPFDVAVFELDEAWAVRFVALMRPQRALLLNVTRDQLDRFGEIDTTAGLLGRVAAATTSHLVLNRDDHRIAALAERTSADVSYFGVAPDLRTLFPNDDDLYGGTPFVSDHRASVELRALPTGEEPNPILRIDDADHSVPLHATGPHNAQNPAAAAALALTFGLDNDTVLAGLAKVSPAFGRGESFDIEGRHLVLQLVKNPAGFRQILSSLDGPTAPDAVVIAINDDYADGRDVSWLWDVDFTGLADSPGREARISTAGTRATDMAVRLRYDGVDVDDVEPDVDKAIRAAVDAAPRHGHVVVLSTYTAMWALHPTLLRIRQAT